MLVNNCISFLCLKCTLFFVLFKQLRYLSPVLRVTRCLDKVVLRIASQAPLRTVGMVTRACNPSIWELQSHPHLHSEFEANLDYMRPCLIKTNKKKGTSKVFSCKPSGAIDVSHSFTQLCHSYLEFSPARRSTKVVCWV